MEKIMTKTNDTSKVAALEGHRPLADSELDAVSGAASPSVTVNGGPLAFCAPLVGSSPYNEGAMRVWNDLLRQNGL
jgi:hypothetical protein